VARELAEERLAKHKKEAVANQDLWRELLQLTEKNRVRLEKVKGHAAIPGMSGAISWLVRVSRS
jgi:ribonuclease HI